MFNLDALGGGKDVRARKFTFVDQLKFGSVMIFGGLFIVVTFAIMLLVFLISPLFLVLVLMPLVIFVMRRASKKQTKAGVFEQIAKDNDWKYPVTLPEDVTSNLRAFEGTVGRPEAIEAKIENRTFWLLWDDGGALAILDANRELPSAEFINSLLADGMFKQAFAQMLKQDNLERISLEGDFDKHFLLYANPSQKLEVLSVVAPDFMMQLLDKGIVSGVSLKDRFVTIPSYSNSKEHLRGLFGAIEALHKEIK